LFGPFNASAALRSSALERGLPEKTPASLEGAPQEDGLRVLVKMRMSIPEAGGSGVNLATKIPQGVHASATLDSKVRTRALRRPLSLQYVIPSSYDSAMPRRLTVFMLFVLFVAGCRGQRAFTYKLHNRQNDDQYSTLHTMPDGALLMVSKRFEQPKQIWNLVRIGAWDTSQPREDWCR
jgi:hypothetical protein